MTYHRINTDKFVEIKYGNIFYELKERVADVTNKIPYNNLIEELQQFLSTIEEKKDCGIEMSFPTVFQEDIDDNDLSDFLNLDECLAMSVNYNENFTLKDLQKIAEYYEISTRKLSKAELIEHIIAYEDNTHNNTKTKQRKKLWHYMKEIKRDKYLRSFLIFDSPAISK
tara:strand:- start:40 stop:546 length:507 start_codon:yes stop_codon:yes gene_type:complete